MVERVIAASFTPYAAIVVRLVIDMAFAFRRAIIFAMMPLRLPLTLLPSFLH